MASENVTAFLPSQSTPGSACASAASCSYSGVTTLYDPNRHGSARSTVRAHRPRVVSSPRYERIPAEVVSTFQRWAYRSTTSGGDIVRSVVWKYASRCVPVRSRTYTRRTGTSPAPPLYQCPVPRTASPPRRPPPYQATLQRLRGACPTTRCGGGGSAPFLRGRPLGLLPRTKGGG